MIQNGIHSTDKITSQPATAVRPQFGIFLIAEVSSSIVRLEPTAIEAEEVTLQLQTS